MTEIADGIHRIESDLAETPAAVIDPYLSRAGLEPDYVVISHA